LELVESFSVQETTPLVFLEVLTIQEGFLTPFVWRHDPVFNFLDFLEELKVVDVFEYLFWRRPPKPNTVVVGLGKLDGVAVEPINVLTLWLNQDYVGADDVPLLPGQRVVHATRGAGTLSYFIGVNVAPPRRVFVTFDTPPNAVVPCQELTHA